MFPGSSVKTDDLEMTAFVKSKRGTPLLMDKEGNVYYCNERHVTRWYWKCREYKRASKKCSARAITYDGNNAPVWKGQHNH